MVAVVGQTRHTVDLDSSVEEPARAGIPTEAWILAGAPQ